MVKGRIVRFDRGRGFGFIRPLAKSSRDNHLGDDLFFHRSDVVSASHAAKPVHSAAALITGQGGTAAGTAGGLDASSVDERLQPGAIVSFAEAADTQGRRKAVEIVVLRPEVSPFRFYGSAVVMIGLVAGVGARLLAPEMPLMIAYLLGISVACFVLAGFDKSVARSTTARVPEWVLLGGALGGGTIGLFLGMHFFRHKTRQARFQFYLLSIFAVQLYLFQLLR